MNGKSKCKILKDIRRQIAAENDIEFVTSECKYQGECPGTCPKCEAEVRYLEQELVKRQKAGRAVAVAGIAATIIVSTTGCLPSTTMGTPIDYPETSQSTPATNDVPTSNGEDFPILGGIDYVPPTTIVEPPTTVIDPPLMGVPVDPNLWD